MNAKWLYLVLFLLVPLLSVFFVPKVNAGYSSGTEVCAGGVKSDIDMDSSNPRAKNKAGERCWCNNDGSCSNGNICINNICREHTNSVGFYCGGNEDCNSDLTCNNHICQPKISCSDPSLNSYSACNNTGSKCFWHYGGKNGTSSCITNDGSNHGESCPTASPAGNCIKNNESCQHGEYCSSSDQGPISPQSPDEPPQPPLTSGVFQCNGAYSGDNNIYYACSTSTSSCNDLSDKYTWSESSKNVAATSCGTNKCCYRVTTANQKLNSYCEPNISNPCSEGSCNNLGTTSSPIYKCVAGSSDNSGNGNNSCTDYDPDYNNSDGVFSCLKPGETCASKGLSNYDKTSYNKCSTGGACCYNPTKYSARKIQSNGTGGGGNPGGGTIPASTNAPGQNTPNSSDVCSQQGKGNVDTAFSKPSGYWDATCDGKFISETDPKTAVKGRKYADRYKCTKTGSDGKNYVDVPVPSADINCDSFPWIDTSVTPVCKAGVGGAVVDCAKVNGPNYTCTFDYNSSGTQDKNTLTHCCPDNKRYCDVAGTCVDAGQGCYGKLSLQSVCVKGNDTDCSDYAAGARCLDPDGDTIFHCLYPPGTPTPTPTAGVAKNCTVGQKGTGCACDSATSCGCAATHNPEPSLDDPTKYYCMPFPSTGMKWCSVTKSAMPANTDPAVCKGSTPYSTPTPISKGCPNDGNHLCVPTNYCQAGFGPSNDSAANTACAGWNPDTPQCYTRGNQPLSTCTATPPVVTSAPGTTTTPVPTKGPAATGCPIDNGDGRVNSCQQACTKESSYPNPRIVGNDDCKAAYGEIRGACCTSN